MSWWNKPKTEQEQTTLTKLMERMGLMDIEMVKMSAQLDNCDQKIKVLRGFMNKKLNLVDPEPEEADQEEEIPSDGFDFLRTTVK